jgi:DNA invertase Pin-like site-specific DNA recombinase
MKPDKLRSIFGYRPPIRTRTTRDLRQIAVRAGWEVVEVYRDYGISGAKGRDQRPAFDAMCSDAAARKFNIVMA